MKKMCIFWLVGIIIVTHEEKAPTDMMFEGALFKAGLLAETKLRVAEKLKEFFVRYYD